MQQVGKRAMEAGALLVDPRSLPVPHRNPARRAANNLSRAWVLHRRLILRILLALLAVAVLAGLYQLRERIADGVSMLVGFGEAQIADAGFAVEIIAISGQTLTAEQAIVAALAIEPRTATVAFDAEAARRRIAELPAIDTVSVRKVYPGRLEVTVTEKTPIARWRVDGVTFLVDAAGEQIGQDFGAYGELPLVIGDGAAAHALVMIRALEQFPDLTVDLIAISRIADRRWDLIYDTGLRVQLPELGVAQALRDLQAYQRDYALLDRDVTLIDLRVAEMVAVRPAEPDPET